MRDIITHNTLQQCPSKYGRYTLGPGEGGRVRFSRSPSTSPALLFGFPSIFYSKSARYIPVTPCEIFDDEKTISRYLLHLNNCWALLEMPSKIGHATNTARSLVPNNIILYAMTSCTDIAQDVYIGTTSVMYEKRRTLRRRVIFNYYFFPYTAMFCLCSSIVISYKHTHTHIKHPRPTLYGNIIIYRICIHILKIPNKFIQLTIVPSIVISKIRYLLFIL